MNVMRLSNDPVKAARFHPDATGDSTVNMTGRMCYEATHIACNALHKNEWVRDFMYKKSHYNHPICSWAAEGYLNFLYVRTLGLALNQEYKDRTNKNEDYGSYDVLARLTPDPEKFPQVQATEQPQCFANYPDCIRDNPVEGYREYFRQVKGPKSEWNNVPRPDWLNKEDMAEKPTEPQQDSNADQDREDEIPNAGLDSFRT